VGADKGKKGTPRDSNSHQLRRGKGSGTVFDSRGGEYDPHQRKGVKKKGRGGGEGNSTRYPLLETCAKKLEKAQKEGKDWKIREGKSMDVGLSRYRSLFIGKVYHLNMKEKVTGPEGGSK